MRLVLFAVDALGCWTGEVLSHLRRTLSSVVRDDHFMYQVTEEFLNQAWFSDLANLRRVVYREAAVKPLFAWLSLSDPASIKGGSRE